VSRIAEAAAYAARIHRGQTRTGTDAPKVAHLFGVTANVLEDAGRNGEVDEDEAVAALLHDAAEDAGGRERLEDVRRRFGDRVAELVEALSDTLDPDPPPWRALKEAYLRELIDEERPSVLRLALADKLDNVRNIVAAHRQQGDAFWERFHSLDDTLWYYGSLADILSRKQPGPMADELQGLVAGLRGTVV
jgi:(p)ppGpp synthase/HD superfamily hydrolase